MTAVIGLAARRRLRRPRTCSHGPAEADRRERGAGSRTSSVRSRRERRKIATENAAQALINLRLAQNAADQLLGEVADQELTEIPQMEPVRQRLLEKARAGYEQFLAQKGNDPLIRWGETGRSSASATFKL